MNSEMKFTDTHEWARFEEDSETLVIVGISNHAQSLLGDIVYLELPEIGQLVSAGDVVGVIESVKITSELHSPLGGEVIAINVDVITNPELINTAPHTLGWLFKLKLSSPDEFNKLINFEKYKNFISQ